MHHCLSLPVSVYPGQALLGNEASKKIKNLKLTWNPCPGTEATNNMHDLVVSLPPVVSRQACGLDIIPIDAHFLVPLHSVPHPLTTCRTRQAQVGCCSFTELRVGEV